MRLMELWPGRESPESISGPFNRTPCRKGFNLLIREASEVRSCCRCQSQGKTLRNYFQYWQLVIQEAKAAYSSMMLQPSKPWTALFFFLYFYFYFFYIISFFMPTNLNPPLWTNKIFLPTYIAPPTHPPADNGTKEIEWQPSVLPPRASAQQSRSLGLLCDLGSATSARMQAELWRCSSSIKAMPNPPVTADCMYSQPVFSLG